MKLIAKIVLMITLTFLCQLFLPWWVIVVVTFLVALFLNSNTPWNAFLSGFTSIAFLWIAVAWWIDIDTDSILTLKVAGLFQLNSGVFIIFITGFIGGLCGGMGALTGYHFRSMIFYD